MKGFFSMNGAFLVGVALAAVSLFGTSSAYGDPLRVSTLGNCSIALIDEDTGLNPYDFGRNPAYLIDDFEGAWVRMSLMLDQESGKLRRPYDPFLTSNLSGGFEGRKRLGGRQAVWGRFTYGRLRQRKQFHSLELDQYNDPFFLTDTTTGDFMYYGPTTKVDYSLRLTPRITFGAGFDYDISTGLKDVYTRPQVIHNYIRGNIGFLVEANKNWLFGLMARPLRIQNRTEFDKTDEGYDNQVWRYSGDSIYEIRSFSSYSIRELLRGGEFGVQNFFTTDRIKIGTVFTYSLVSNQIKYNATDPEETGFWQDEVYDFRFLARYASKSEPLVLGVSGAVMNQQGWARRTRFRDVLLYDNPVKLRSAGAGASYALRPMLLVSADYILNAYDIEADDYGANHFQHRTFTQNIGRLGLEYRAYNVFSLRGGVEVTDYLVDRWLKLPDNMDRYRFTAGGSYSWHLWQIEGQLLYARSTRNTDDRERRDLSGILWFTRSQL